MKDQLHDFNSQNPQTEIVHFVNALAVDSFDVAINQVDDDPTGKHALVELVFTQNKGTNRIEVVSALRMQAGELEKLHALIGKKLEAFKSDK